MEIKYHLKAAPPEYCVVVVPNVVMVVTYAEEDDLRLQRRGERDQEASSGEPSE